jgi:hypothetical protein
MNKAASSTRQRRYIIPTITYKRFDGEDVDQSWGRLCDVDGSLCFVVGSGGSILSIGRHGCHWARLILLCSPVRYTTSSTIHVSYGP